MKVTKVIIAAVTVHTIITVNIATILVILK